MSRYSKYAGVLPLLIPGWMRWRRLAKSMAENKGHADPQLIERFYAAGYNEGSLVDVVMAVGDKIISNYIFALTGIPIDYPLAPELERSGVEG